MTVGGMGFIPERLLMMMMIIKRDWANLALYRDVWRGVVSRC